MKLRQFFFILALMLTTLTVNAQPPKHHDRPDKEHKFNPEQFARAQEAFIVKEAQLTQQETAAFMPVFREMLQKQRTLFRQYRQFAKAKPQNDKEAAKLLKDVDDLDLQIKKIEIDYHAKFCKVISPMKVYQVHKAMNKFKHITMERVAKRKN